MSSLNILIVGVGGQGTLTASRVLGKVAELKGMDVKVSEVHGMAQRGGSVVTHVRISSEKVFSPLVDLGGADIIIAFEKLEALRYIHFLKKGGAIVINDQQIDPMPVVIGAVEYPQNIMEDISKNHRVYKVNAVDEAKKLGNSKVFNIIVLGVAAQHMEFSKDQWLSVIERTVPAKTVEINKKAFELGYSLA